MKNLLYVIPESDRNPAGLKGHLAAHPEIRFASLSGVDLGGNDTDERIPIAHFLAHIDAYLSGGIQTDGSSVVLPGIATLNNGKVDFVADPDVSWYVDYNGELTDPALELPVGTLRIPSFLKHEGRFVDSRSLLKRAVGSCERRLLALLSEHPAVARASGVEPGAIAGLQFTAATELEFWVRTPGSTIETEQLSVSQVLQESYWKRTKGAVRSALELSLVLLERYGLAPEMGHKEVGGVKATVTGQGGFSGIMEQLEVDWKYARALQAADNELLARIMIKETFRRHGLEATFMAKPMDLVAGSGEHTHVNIVAKMRDGSRRNLFAPVDTSADFMGPLGWGALMGLLRNWEAVGAFVTASNDAFNRLKPGFEAPVCIVASTGHDVSQPSRNRTVLVGLLRDRNDPLPTRFEIRAPNPHTNTYLALASFYQAMMDGMAWAARSGQSTAELQAGLFKAPGTAHPYLERERAYRSEENVFEHYDERERVRLFGRPPATVWETLANIDAHPGKTAVLSADGVFTPEIIASYREAALLRWTMELSSRIVPDNARIVHGCVRLQGENRLDKERWQRIEALRQELARDDVGVKSLFTRVREAVAAGEHAALSALQIEMAAKMAELTGLYRLYRRNIEPV